MLLGFTTISSTGRNGSVECVGITLCDETCSWSASSSIDLDRISKICFSFLALDLVIGSWRKSSVQYIFQFWNSSLGSQWRTSWNLSNKVSQNIFSSLAFHSTFRLQATFAMTHRLRDSLLYAGVYNGSLHVYDTRIHNQANNNSRVHLEQVTRRGYIHALELQENYVLVMHKPSTLCLYDQRTWKKVENVPVGIHSQSLIIHLLICWLFS